MKLVLFDIDGTLISMKYGLSKKVFQEVIYNIYGVLTPIEKMPDFSGMTDLSILRSISNYHNIDFSIFENDLKKIFALKLDIFKDYCIPDNFILHSGVIELVETLNNQSNITLGLLTGNAKQNAYQKIETFKLTKYFAFGAFGDDDENRNNLPPIAIKRANNFLNCNIFKSSNTFIIGDSEKDIECSKANDIKVITTLTGGRTKDFLASLNPDLLVENLIDTNLLLNFILEN